MTTTWAKSYRDLCGHDHMAVCTIATAPGEVITLRLLDGEIRPGNPYHVPAADPDAEAERHAAMLRAAGFTETAAA